MTPFEQDLIEALKQIGATDWAGYIINLVGIVIASAFSARVAFKIAKYQTEKQLTKQNILETKKEKRMLATQIRLDKYEDLYASLTEYARLISQSYLNVLYYTHSDEYSEKITIEQLRVNEDDLQQEILLKGNKTEILSAYHPEIMNDWNVLSKIYEEIADIIFDGFTYPGRFEPKVKDSSFDTLKEKHNLFNEQYCKVQDMLTSAIVNIINDLESDL